MSASEIEKYYNDIIESLRLNFVSAEFRIQKLQESEFKLEKEILQLQSELEVYKKKENNKKNLMIGQSILDFVG
jgi:hypothetical protein|tara:strand:- start:733 stop:954 length:222 start_codon:yes stop_codon:yes gene_type:complete